MGDVKMTDNNELIVNYHLAKQEIENAINNAITQYKIPYTFLNILISTYAQQIANATNTELQNAFSAIQNKNETEESEQDTEEVLTEKK